MSINDIMAMPIKDIALNVLIVVTAPILVLVILGILMDWATPKNK